MTKRHREGACKGCMAGWRDCWLGGDDCCEKCKYSMQESHVWTLDELVDYFMEFTAEAGRKLRIASGGPEEREVPRSPEVEELFRKGMREMLQTQLGLED